MPRIDAPTVAEHRAQIQTRLIDAAEEILRSRGAESLTAGAVTGRAGIARNSIYRYVDSVDDLRGLVVARYLPAWLAAVDAEMVEAASPRERVITWTRANLEQAAAMGHGWLMEAVRTASAAHGTPHAGALGAPSESEPADDTVDQAHTGMRDALRQAWHDLLPDDPDAADVATGLTLGAVDAGFRQLDAGQSLGVVVRVSTRAVAGMVDQLTAPTD